MQAISFQRVSHQPVKSPSLKVDKQKLQRHFSAWQIAYRIR
jgi:hypothetical protein